MEPNLEESYVSTMSYISIRKLKENIRNLRITLNQKKVFGTLVGFFLDAGHEGNFKFNVVPIQMLGVV